MNRILNSDVLCSHGARKGRQIMTELLDVGLTAADPYWKAKDLIQVEDKLLHIGGADFEPIGSPRTGMDTYDMDKDIDRIFIFGAGKGIWRAIQAFEETLGDRLTGGHVILKHGDEASSKRLGITWGGHPVPDAGCVEGCRKMVEYIRNANLTERDLVITVCGNGVSSLLTLPPEGMELADIQAITRVIQIERGFPTPMLNIVRNQVDQLKGGRITRLFKPAKMVHTFTIDINEGNDAYNLVGYRARTEVNEWLHTLPDISTPEMAIQFLRENDIWDHMPPAVQEYLLHGGRDNPVMKVPEFESLDCRFFGLMPQNRSHVPAVMQKAREMGIAPHWMTKQYFASASEIGKLMCGIAKLVDEENTPFQTPCVMIYTGEGLVATGGTEGVGGRNQELALAAAIAINGRHRIVVGAVDTDGTDGPGGFINQEAENQGVRILSGGIVDGYTMAEAAERGVDIAGGIRTHASSDPLWRLDSAVQATQNISINDLVLVLVMDQTD